MAGKTVEHPPPSQLRILAWIFAEICIIGTLVVLVVFITKYPSPVVTLKYDLYKYYDWHAVLNTFGFIGFMFNAIMAFRLYPGSHYTRKIVHLILHTIAISCSIVAVVLMFKFHNKNNITNMYSTHSVVGMAALIMACIQWLMGVMSFIMPCSPLWMRAMSKPFHMFFGAATMVAVAAACALGAFDRQRLTWEIVATIPYNAVINKWANGYAMCVFASLLGVGLVLHHASDKLVRVGDHVEMRGTSRDEYAKLSDGASGTGYRSTA